MYLIDTIKYTVTFAYSHVHEYYSDGSGHTPHCGYPFFIIKFVMEYILLSSEVLYSYVAYNAPTRTFI